MRKRESRRESFDQWEKRERARDPNWDRGIRELSRRTGVPRKISLVLDANLEAEVVHDLKGSRGYRILVASGKRTDGEIWDWARSEKAVLITADGSDFWNDRRFHLRDSPGLIVLSAPTASGKLEALAVAFVHWDIEKLKRLGDHYLTGMKIRASPSGTTAKFWSGRSVVETTTRRPLRRV